MNHLYLKLILALLSAIAFISCDVGSADLSDPEKEPTKELRRPKGKDDRGGDPDENDDEDLGPPATFQTFDQRAKTQITLQGNNVAAVWPGQKLNEERTILDTKEILISYNFRWGVLSMCTPDLLMIDVDIGDQGAPDKKTVTNRLKQYARREGIALALRESDRGIHAFVVSKKIDPKSEESMRVMWENYGDTRYIAYSKLRGYCARIGPKIFKTVNVGPGHILLDQKQMNDEFVSRKPAAEIIGDKKLVDQALLKKLYVNDDLVKIVRQEFASNYAIMTSARYLGTAGRIPNAHLKGALLNQFKSALTTASFPVNGAPYVLEKGTQL